MFKKIKFYKRLLFEMVETLCSICLYLDSQGRLQHNTHSEHLRSNAVRLKELSEELRKDIYG